MHQHKTRRLAFVLFAVSLGACALAATALPSTAQLSAGPPPPPTPPGSPTSAYGHLFLGDAHWQVNGATSTSNSPLLAADLAIVPPGSTSYVVGGWWNHVNSLGSLYGIHADINFRGIGGGVGAYFSPDGTADYSPYILLRSTGKYSPVSLGIGPYWAAFASDTGGTTRQLGYNAFLNDSYRLNKRLTIDGSLWYISVSGERVLRTTVGIGINFG